MDLDQKVIFLNLYINQESFFVFPKYNNTRSSIFIDNFAIFIKEYIDKESGGIFFPQNNEYYSTAKIVRFSRTINGRRVIEFTFLTF